MPPVELGWLEYHGKEGAPEDRGRGKVAGNICPEETSRSFDSALPGPLTLGQAGGTGAGSYSSSWEEVAGS